MVAPIGFPTSAASSVAGMRCTTTGAVITWAKVESLTRTSPPGRSFGSIGAQNSSCMAMADHARDTTGGAVIGSSATTTVLSVLPPRIIPP